VADGPGLHLGVALDGAGWHPASWREPDARPADLFDAGYWVDLAKRAEAGLLDFITIEDSLRLQSERPFAPDRRTDRVRGRLDAVLIAARVAPTTLHLGLIPTVRVTHTEPFHVSKAIATLDYVSRGRAGVRVQVSARADEARHFGRRELPLVDLARRDDPAVAQLVARLFDEAEDYVEVVRRLWDSWEDNAEIRDVATGRFIDRDRLHYIEFSGQWFSVRGPSVTPRPPQGQPLVAALGHAPRPYQLIARSADLGFVTPRHARHASEIVGEIRRHEDAAGRPSGTVAVLADLVVFLDRCASAATARKDRLDDSAGEQYRSDAHIFVGSASELADLLDEWAAMGISGFRLRPGALPHDLDQIIDGLVPELRRRGRFRRTYQGSTLRGLFGLDRPANRYVACEG
jgi:alkanesulfonate monooxygenase SsuD/methylene tetrahydromethanopterin reductase-like flavin-dependent oxidoreductase (luciferase family)